MADRWVLQAWTLPDPGPFDVKLPDVRFNQLDLDLSVAADERGTVWLPARSPLLDQIVDPENNVGSMLRAFQRDEDTGALVPVLSFFARRDAGNLDDGPQGTESLSGSGPRAILSTAVVYPFDHPNSDPDEPNQPVQRDHMYGNPTNLLDNPEFDEIAIENGDFETGTTEGWDTTGSTRGFVPIDPGEDSFEATDTEADTGTYSGKFDPAVKHSGIRRTFTVQPGERYLLTARLKSNTVGKRFTMAARAESGYVDFTTNGFVYNGYVMCELDNVARNPAGNGLPGGSTDGTWQDLAIDIQVGSDQTRLEVVIQYDHHDATNGPIAYVDNFTASGPGLGLVPWEPIGDLATFEQSQTQVLKGSNSAKIVPNTGTALADGIRQVVTVETGKHYTWGIWVYHTAVAARSFQVRLRRKGGTNVAVQAVSVSPATWTLVKCDGVVTDTEEVWCDLRYNDTDTPDIWLDSASLAEGLPAATWGKILQDLMNDAAVDHVAELGTAQRSHLQYVRYDSFDDINDSNGNPWPEELSLRIRMGKTYEQVANEVAREYGYETTIVDNPNYPATEPEPFMLVAYVPYDATTRTGGRGQTRTGGNDGVLATGASVTGGPVVKTTPSRTAAFAAGAAHVAFDSDAAAVAAWGRREIFVSARNALDFGTVSAAAAQVVEESVSRTVSANVELVHGVYAPIKHFGLGDTVNTNLAPRVGPGPRRFVGCSISITPGKVPTYRADLEAVIYEGAAGQAEAVARLLRKFDERDDAAGAAAADLSFEETPLSPVDILVAANNARLSVRNFAELDGLVCDGIDDMEEIQAASDILAEVGAANGKVQLSGGNFSDLRLTTLVWSIPSTVAVVGAGENATFIEFDISASIIIDCFGILDRVKITKAED